MTETRPQLGEDGRDDVRHEHHVRTAIAFWVGLVCLSLPLFCVYLSQLWSDPKYTCVIFLPLAVVSLLAFRWDKRILLPNALSWPFIAISIFLGLLSCVLLSPWLASASFAAAIVSFALVHTGKTGTREDLLLVAIGALLAVRLPIDIEQRLFGFFDRLTGRLATLVIDGMGTTHRISSEYLELADNQWNLEVVAGGYVSFYCYVLASWMWMVVRRRSLTLMPLYLLACALFAIVGNVVRIQLVTVFWQKWAIDCGEGMAWLLSQVLLLVGFLLFLASADSLLRILFYPVPSSSLNSQETNPIASAWNRVFSLLSVYGRRRKGLRDESDSRPRRVVYRVVVGLAIALMTAILAFQCVSAFRYESRTSVAEQRIGALP
jgi:hypothetical protein